ncbi:fibronectin type III domain-containing protein [Streptomyces glaucescens]|uniref:fibronectin type III domain-containing protein n=1 Tax=Streptomyces glaucescens TaxID=1907 RepID=UPI000A364DEE|nr:PA14 domain-containing protein [Streptomyces glaucescens]
MNPARRTTATALVLATAGGVLTTAATTATAATSCTSPAFKREFFANTTFSGTPKKTDCDSAIDQNWGNGAPVSGVPSNNFGVRWSLTRDFGSGGPFAFSAAAQDGIRVYLDGVRKVDLWKNVSTTARKTVNVTIPSGRHTLRVDFVNWTGTANVKFTYAPRTSATVDKVRPLTPTGTAVAYDTATGKAKLTWSRNKEMDLANYRVYRRLKGSSYGATPLATTTAASWTDATLPKTGAAYYYEVRAVDKAGNVSGGSADQLVTTVDRTPPAAPFVEIDVCADDVTVAGPELVTTAANQADIAEYQAQRQDPATKAWSTVYTGAKGAFCDRGRAADGTQATYRGRARDAAGNWSVYSAATTVKVTDGVPPAIPANARVEYRSGVPHLLWDTAPDAVRYEVLQHDLATGGWLDAFGDTAATTRNDVVPQQRTALADEYRYAVRAFDAVGNASAPAGITLRMAERPEAIAPYQLTAGRSGDAVLLSWRSTDPWAVSDAHLPTYEIVRTDPATGESTTVEQCSPVNGTGAPQPPSTHTTPARDDLDPAYVTWPHPVVYATCVEGSGASETTYEYRIVAVDRHGHRSAASAPVTAAMGDTVRPAPVTDLTAEVVPMGVRLTWNPPADDDVIEYYVWQGTTDPETGGTVWNRNCVTGDSLGETEILCPTLPDGREHVYRVAASDRVYLDEGPDTFHPAEVRVTLPDTRPVGWTGTWIGTDQYPELSVRCGQVLGDPPCDDWTDYRLERWDPATASWTTLATGTVDAPRSFMDETVHDDHLGLYYYRAVYSDPTGNEKVMWERAYGIWEPWL